MPPEPTIGSISLALTSLRKIFGAYSAYSSGHFVETDQGLRDEILRRVTMLQNHLNTFENQALEARKADVIQAIQRVRTTCSGFEQSVQMGISGTSASSHPQAEKVSKKVVKKLIQSDYSILEKLVLCMNTLNAAQDSLVTSPSEVSVLIQQLTQSITSAQNRYHERNSYIGQIQ